MKKLLLVTLICFLTMVTSCFSKNLREHLYNYAKDSDIRIEHLTSDKNLITMIHRRSSTFYMGSPLVFTLASFIDLHSMENLNQAIIWYSKNYGKPRKLIINVDNDEIVEIPVTNYALGKQQPRDERLIKDISKFFVLGVFGMLGNPNYNIYKCKINFDSSDITFTKINSMYLYTYDGFYIPLFVKYKNRNRYENAKEVIENAFFNFKYLDNVIKEYCGE
jgi:hypothetical protein